MLDPVHQYRPAEVDTGVLKRGFLPVEGHMEVVLLNQDRSHGGIGGQAMRNDAGQRWDKIRGLSLTGVR